jgi:hypothetical protein
MAYYNTHDHLGSVGRKTAKNGDRHRAICPSRIGSLIHLYTD